VSDAVYEAHKEAKVVNANNASNVKAKAKIEAKGKTPA